ncbi:MAG: fused response regulator/phosphatase [Alphaproteobacteria bacterium]|nr:MAG: fused response regulator/phosphatase [Alphaproteobacteria bacterium]TAF40818.1 MAG: fused response regulator/phosphatase [Alphaproteobacteria bacterium]TAF77006.1 MAG: fused response regulator/phosphatase [Alphaproteobacteria bacterium]
MTKLCDEAPIDYSTQTILIVDDSPTCRALLRAFFQQVGFIHIDEAIDGMQALEKIHQHAPDLLLVDMHMPRMDGLALCQSLFDDGLHHDIAIIMMSQSVDMRLRSRAFEIGVMDFITKPLYETEVIARTLAHLERHLLSRNVQMHYLRLQQEIDDALKVQRFLLPTDALIANIYHQTSIDVAYHHQPASTLAGDYLSIRNLGNGKIMLTLADVSGHGIAAALYSFSIHALLNHALVSSEDPSEILSILNKQLINVMTDTSFATMCIVIIDGTHKRLTYASAASPMPILVRSDGTILSLESTGTVLGMFDDAHYPSVNIESHAGDVLLLYSDTLVESMRSNGNLIEEHEVHAVLHSRQDASSSAIMNAVLQQFSDYDLAHLHDDLTLLACKI